MSLINVPPSELSMNPLPPGLHARWVPDEGCRVADEIEHRTKRCRRPRCYGAPVMAIRRSNGDWLYCAEHLYGHRISNGVVEQLRRVTDEDAT